MPNTVTTRGTAAPPTIEGKSNRFRPLQHKNGINPNDSCQLSNHSTAEAVLADLTIFLEVRSRPRIEPLGASVRTRCLRAHTVSKKPATAPNKGHRNENNCLPPGATVPRQSPQRYVLQHCTVAHRGRHRPVNAPKGLSSRAPRRYRPSSSVRGKAWVGAMKHDTQVSTRPCPGTGLSRPRPRPSLCGRPGPARSV